MNKFGNSNFELKLKPRKRVKLNSTRLQLAAFDIYFCFLIEQLLIALEWYLIVCFTRFCAFNFNSKFELPNFFNFWGGWGKGGGGVSITEKTQKGWGQPTAFYAYYIDCF